jgi:hypothetical protein
MEVVNDHDGRVTALPCGWRHSIGAPQAVGAGERDMAALADKLPDQLGLPVAGRAENIGRMQDFLRCF